MIVLCTELNMDIVYNICMVQIEFKYFKMKYVHLLIYLIFKVLYINKVKWNTTLKLQNTVSQ